jgi:hypothetical protein
MSVLLLNLQEEGDDELMASWQLLTKFKISWHLYFISKFEKSYVQGQRKANFFEIFFLTE